MKYAMMVAFVVAVMLFSSPDVWAGCSGGSCSIGSRLSQGSCSTRSCSGRRGLFPRLRLRR